jgi:hypothetical protein
LKSVVLVVACLCPLLGSADPVQWTIASGGNGHYYEYVPIGRTLVEARADALSRTWLGLPGYLVTITSEEENLFVRSLVVDATLQSWLGGSDEAEEGTWRWLDGPEAGMIFWQGDQNASPIPGVYENWDFNEPGSSGNEDAVAMWQFNTSSWGRWGDFIAGDHPHYLVEYSAIVPEPGAAIFLGSAATCLALYWFGRRIV